MCCLPYSKTTFFTIQLTYSIIHELNNSRTKQLTNLKNHELEILRYILQNARRLSLPSSEKKAQKHANWHYFQPFLILFLSIFGHITCILHHFAFLVWLPTRNFPTPITRFLALKSHFLVANLPFLAMCFMVWKGFVYTIVVDIYAFHLTSSSILHCI